MNSCKDCGRRCLSSCFPAGAGTVRCLRCATRATGLSIKAMRALYGGKIKICNFKRQVNRLKGTIAKYEALEAIMQERIDYLEDEIATMLDDRKTFDREIKKHGGQQ